MNKSSIKKYLLPLVALLVIGALYFFVFGGEDIKDPSDTSIDTLPLVTEGGDTSSPAETKTPDTGASETKVPETFAPETDAPETKAPEAAAPETDAPETEAVIDENGSYLSLEDVALYIHTYGHLPANYLTKSEAQSRGWVSSKGNLWDVAYGCAIGGDRFGNYEKLLPEKKGRTYTECDVNYSGGYRDEQRIIFSNDGLIFFTDDHYESFTQLYGD